MRQVYRETIRMVDNQQDCRRRGMVPTNVLTFLAAETSQVVVIRSRRDANIKLNYIFEIKHDKGS